MSGHPKGLFGAIDKQQPDLLHIEIIQTKFDSGKRRGKIETINVVTITRASMNQIRVFRYPRLSCPKQQYVFRRRRY